MPHFFSLVRPLDLQGARRANSAFFGKMLGFFERIIQARLKDETGAKMMFWVLYSSLSKTMRSPLMTLNICTW